MLQKQMTASRINLCVALFFILLLALGLWTSLDYGQPWDEVYEQDVLRMNMNEYAAFFGIDVRYKALSDIDEPDDGLVSGSIERDHGQSAYYPVFFLVTSEGLPGSARMVLWHMYTWLWMMAGAASLYFITRRMGLSRPLGCAAVLFLMLSPRLFAQGHYNNKDIVLLSLLLLSLWLALRLAERPSVGRAVPFALVGAIAANTKIIGLFLFGLCAVFVLVRLVWEKRMDKRAWAAAAATLILVLAFWFLLTPAMWRDPPGYIGYTFTNAFQFTRWVGYVLFRGSYFGYGHNPLPYYYLPYMIVVTTPLWLLLLIGAGQAFAAKHMLENRRKLLTGQAAFLLLCTLLWLIPMAMALVFKPIIYNGWRHFYFLMAPMLILAAYGLDRIWAALNRLKRRVYARVFAAALAGCMGITGIGMVVNHPTQYAYYNPLPRGDLTETMELDYWNVSVLGTLRSLLDTAQGDITVSGAELWSQAGLQYAYAALPEALQKRVTVLPQEDPAAMYYLANTTYARFGLWEPGTMEPAAQTMSYGRPICTVYRSDRADEDVQHE